MKKKLSPLFEKAIKDYDNRENPEEIKRSESERIERIKNELLQKKVEVGQVRELTVDKSTRLDDLNGAEVRVTYVNQESGWVGFELTENNSPDMSEAIKGRPLMAEIRSLFNQVKKEVQEKITSHAEKMPKTSEELEGEREQFRKAVEEKKIEVGKYYIIKKEGPFKELRSKILGIDYTDCKIQTGMMFLGREIILLLEIDELGEEVSIPQERVKTNEDKLTEEFIAEVKRRKLEDRKRYKVIGGPYSGLTIQVVTVNNNSRKIDAIVTGTGRMEFPSLSLDEIGEEVSISAD